MRLGVGRGMTTVEELSVSPASDCNSNNVDASYASTTSDVEFIQDNCDYQWFPDCGYREVQHRSVLSSCYDYDEMARDLDSQLAQVDMEDYSAQDILSTLPAICGTEVQNEHRGEMFASVSGSLMVKFEFDSSISPHTSSQDESSMSLCQSEPLFSPVKEVPLFPTNYSVDSLDCDDQDHLIVTCQANKHNYTIAFHGSTVIEDGSDFTDGESLTSLENPPKKNDMAVSDAGTTTWSKLRRVPAVQPRQRSKTISLPDLAPPAAKLSSSLALGRCMKLYDIQNSGSSTSESFSGGSENRTCPNKQGNFSLLKMFIAQRSCMEQNHNNDKSKVKCKVPRNTNEIGSMTDTAWMEDLSACYEDSLVKDNTSSGGGGNDIESPSVERLSSKSVSICSCSMSSSAANRFNVNNNNSFERQIQKHNVKVGTSGSELSEPTSSSDQTANTKLVVNERKCPIHCVDRSMQTSSLLPASSSNGAPSDVNAKESSASSKGNSKKPVYVLYPNYTLPDLGFLKKHCLDLDRVLLAPFKFTGNSPQSPPSTNAPYRTVTKHDMDMLRQKGVSHVLDWSSLTPLLPQEYWHLLNELPQIRQHSAARFDHSRPQFCVTPTTSKELPTFTDLKSTNVNSSTGSSGTTGTGPSSGYRGSSTLLSESGSNPSNPLYVYNYGTDEKIKRQRKTSCEVPENKRYSMFEFGSLEDVLDQGVNQGASDKVKKRKSFPNPKDPSMEKEMWDDWWKDTKQRPNSPPSTHAHRLDQLIELSGHDQWMPQDIDTLRDQVSKFLSEVGKKCVSFAHHEGDQQLTPPNSPTAQKNYQGKSIGLELRPIIDQTENKKTLVDGIAEAVDKVVNYNEENVSQVVLDSLCPALYAFLSDGLKQQLETPFGPISNSVWQVVEASAQQSPMTRGLHDLVVKINSEDVLSEGLIKFNAFVFGLLNVKGLDAWVSYVRTRESILTKHYTDASVLLSASKGQAKSRSLTDQLINTLKPLCQCDFNLDLLFETRLLHESLLQLTRVPLSPSQQNSDLSTSNSILRKIVQSLRSGGFGHSPEQSQSSDYQLSRSPRPRSCVDALAGSDVASAAKKRWSGVHMGSRLVNAFDRLQHQDEEFPDSLEPDVKSSSDENTDKDAEAVEKDSVRGGKFRSLQKKWEMLSGREAPDMSPVKSSGQPRSKIPRPVTSPVRPQSRLPTLIKDPPDARKRNAQIPVVRSRTADARLTRTSRADAPPEKVVTSRPSSLPYRPPSSAKVQRRAASSSTVRGGKPAANSSSGRTVVTLTHRLPKDSGHLAFNEGERLRLVLEVDDTWLLCCRGDQKGLVPRSSVI
ncbi:RUN and SH3 domain containing 2 [Nesidiocoris tenuis]|uniref:RUN and SH3 domain containing 2 n=1 Tax=Nesidiocoris tenuis TaxID=355587 RepID=A0ABN7A973_9HEMI|nr:RUN and SH3 domain containing 2 [Nesidiocoris tenuis]